MKFLFGFMKNKFFRFLQKRRYHLMNGNVFLYMKMRLIPSVNNYCFLYRVTFFQFLGNPIFLYNSCSEILSCFFRYLCMIYIMIFCIICFCQFFCLPLISNYHEAFVVSYHKNHIFPQLMFRIIF